MGYTGWNSRFDVIMVLYEIDDFEDSVPTYS